MSLVWIQPSELEKRHPVIKWPMILLVNKRGGVISVPKPRAEFLLKKGSHFNAPEGAKVGMYFPHFDSLNQLVVVKEETVKPPKTTSRKKKTASSKRFKHPLH